MKLENRKVGIYIFYQFKMLCQFCLSSSFIGLIMFGDYVFKLCQLVAYITNNYRYRHADDNRECQCLEYTNRFLRK